MGPHQQRLTQLTPFPTPNPTKLNNLQHAWLRNCWLHLRRLRMRAGSLQLRKINSRRQSIRNVVRHLDDMTSSSNLGPPVFNIRIYTLTWPALLLACNLPAGLLFRPHKKTMVGV